jgi:D-inositol-3-phosphate glycosyltransferase
MKIILLGPAHPYRGGPATFNDRLAVQFSREGHNTEIYTFTLQYPGLLFPGKSQFTDSPVPGNIKITRILNSVNPVSWIITGRRIKKENPDVLIMRYWLPFLAPCLGTAARTAKANKHTIVLCIFDNVVPHEKRPGDRILTKYLINSIDGAIVMSQSVLEDLKEFRTGFPVRLSPHPLFDNYSPRIPREPALSSLGLDGSYSYLLFFGFIRAYKGLDLLIEAYSDSRLRGRNIKLLVAGEFYGEEAPYRELVNKYRLADEIIFFNRFVRDNEVPQFFSVADLVVQPYRSATQSGVTQIAFHYGKPVLVTDVGGLRETVTDGRCGYVVRPEAVDIADAIVDFYDNSRKEEFEEGVEEEKKRFEWEKMTASVIDVYKECLSGSDGQA